MRRKLKTTGRIVGSVVVLALVAATSIAVLRPKPPRPPATGGGVGAAAPAMRMSVNCRISPPSMAMEYTLSLRTKKISRPSVLNVGLDSMSSVCVSWRDVPAVMSTR